MKQGFTKGRLILYIVVGYVSLFVTWACECFIHFFRGIRILFLGWRWVSCCRCGKRSVLFVKKGDAVICQGCQRSGGIQ